MLSYWHHYRYETVAAVLRRGQWIAMVAATVLILPAVYLPPEHPFVHTIGFTCLYVGFGLILLVSLHRTRSGASELDPLWRGLAGIGLYSYSIYLWHIPVRHFGLGSLRMAVGGPLPYALELGLFVAGSIVVGIAMAKLVEMPALRLRDRMFPSMSKPLTGPAPGRAICPTDGVWVRAPIVKSHPSNDSGSPRMP